MRSFGLGGSDLCVEPLSRDVCTNMGVLGADDLVGALEVIDPWCCRTIVPIKRKVPRFVRCGHEVSFRAYLASSGDVAGVESLTAAAMVC